MAKTRIIDLSELKPDEANAREHDQANLAAIRNSLERFGSGRSIVVDGNDVVRAGNGTIEAAKAAGLNKVLVVEPEADTLVAVKRADWSEQEAKGYGVADNRAAELARWNLPSLEAVIALIPDIDIDDIGFGSGQLDALLDTSTGNKEPGDVVEDEPPEPPAEPMTQLGDVWLLGRHSLVCGDSTEPNDVAKLSVDTVDAVITDPPYGVDYVGKTKDKLKIQNDKNVDISGLLHAAFGNAIRLCRPGGAWWVTAPPGPPFLIFAQALHRLGVWRQTVVWVKDAMVLGHSDYHYRHEPIFYGWAPGAPHQPPPTRDKTTVWEFPRPKASKKHPTMKPVALLARAMADTIPVDATVYDPFLGSGTTLIAAEQMQRRCVGVEIEPKYCDVIVERWEKLTGQKAKRVTG